MQTVKKIILFLLGLIVLLLVIILLQPIEARQVDPGATSFVFPDALVNINFDVDSLRRIVGENKTLPPGYEVPALLAYSAYPQLRDVNIEMVLTEEGAPMESNFALWSLFGKKKNRVYRILLNDAQNTPFDEILLYSLPLDAQVGILAHELGHVAYYDRLSTLQIAKWGIMYLIDEEFRATHEKTTDLMPVYHGLGSQIYQYAYYVRNDTSCVKLYEQFGAEFIDKFYMTDKELQMAISNHHFYSKNNNQ